VGSVKGKRLRRTSIETLYWYIYPDGDSEYQIAKALLLKLLADAMVAFSPSRVPCIRVMQHKVNEDTLRMALPNCAIVSKDNMSYLHTNWVDLQASSK